MLYNCLQTRITAIDLLTFAASENTPDCFLHADAEDIESFVNKVRYWNDREEGLLVDHI